MRNQSMGVGKAMKIFMEGMQNSMVSSGYTGKIVNTQMGPFSWNEETNSWVNQNNGFSIPNISLQDLMMYDYGSIADETESSTFRSTPCVNTINISPTSDSIATLRASQVLLTNATLSTLTCPTNVFLKQTSTTGNNVNNLIISYRIDNGTIRPWLFTGTNGINNTTNNISVSAGNFKIYVQRETAYLAGTTINFSLNNADKTEELSTYQVTIE